MAFGSRIYSMVPDMEIIDIHSHLQFSDFEENREDIIAELKQRNWGTIVVGTNEETSRKAVDLAYEHKNIWATVGQHPTVLKHVDTTTYRSIIIDSRSSVGDSRIVAIGECGLDYYRTPRDQVLDKQVNNFQAQIDLAAEFKMPLVLHGRPTAGSMNAYEDMLDILRNRRDELPDDPGNAHFFVGDVAVAKRFIDMNFTVSFDGPITFAREYDEVIRFVPVDMIHAETDAPYVAPVPYRGQQNSPLYVDEIIKALANIRQEKNLQSFSAQLVANARRVFKF